MRWCLCLAVVLLGACESSVARINTPDSGGGEGGAAGGTGTSGGTTGGTTGGRQGGTAGGVTGGTAGGTAGGFAGGTTGASGGTSGGRSGGVAGGTSGGGAGGSAGGSAGAVGGIAGGATGGTAGGATGGSGGGAAGGVTGGSGGGAGGAGGAGGGSAGGTGGGHACGAEGQPCCNGSCTADLVCAVGQCVTAVRPYTCPGGATPAVFVAEQPPPLSVEPWTAIEAAITFANCSGQTWVAAPDTSPTGHKLGFDGPRDYDVWGPTRVALPANVPTGNQVTVPLRVRAPPLTGSLPWRWAILNEGVAWLSAPSPLRTVTVQAVSFTSTICAGVTADVGGGASASRELQTCIDATASGRTLEIPPGIYRITGELNFTRPITLRTANTATVAEGCLARGGPRCAVLRADENLNVPRGLVRLGATSDVTLDHVVIDGNRALRLASAAATSCAGGTTGAGFNATTSGCSNCALRKSASARALCGTGWEWSGPSASITDCVFRENGGPSGPNMMADGLTLLESNGATVTGNRFVDNSGVDLVFGGGTNATVQNNSIEHLTQASLAGLMLGNFNGTTSGDFTATTVSDNWVLCGPLLCDFAVQLGPHAWHLSANTIGGTVTRNTVMGGKFNINVEGAGTAASPMLVTQNTIGPAPSSAAFLCGTRPSTAFNVSRDSFVNTGSGPAPTGALTHHQCP